ncbi:acetoacetate metabolism transcriptional regulator AtoC [Azospirillum doebereinerae]|uniref:Acetoacetate metabolism regulator AtoC n=1 Tax=Azospirillum doebereinerae TaxID=92933 RepID=A0A433J991_9PROT|nr:acetoacetate metabolism transcriptional regulator AtoC [Azospirillum doebereinerae]MCG5244002.1 acetoacetate metabolism transcriptional regulator AtoC [Azospirillum doebereinerae]RUQ71323.1 acetoacetate metabolism regulator AtoC [Azospirillum doebereinerae]
MTPPFPTALVVDDDEAIRQMLAAVLSREGFAVTTAADGVEAVAAFAAQRPALVLMDIRMPRMTGLQALAEMRKIDRATAVILMTAYAEVETAVQAIKDGAFDYIIKPFDIAELLLLVGRALQMRSLRDDIAVLHRELSASYRTDRILTASPRMAELLQTIAKVAKSTATVLVTGESGTGKELVAAAIHYNSPRSAGPFVKVNCAAVPEGLLESEFFGHEKGAFTGAAARRRGRFEQAEHGTLFLDEIGDISASLQVKLLRVLQEREFERVGGTDLVRIDTRVIVATNKNLEEMVRQGQFRQDLYFRLNVVTLRTVPLRERPEDIRLLASHFLQRFAAENRIDVTGFDDQAMACLMAHGWPGNIRELSNAVERAVVMSTGPLIFCEDLPEQLACRGDDPAEPSLGPSPEPDHPPVAGGTPLRDQVSRFEARVVAETLARNGGNRMRTAQDLGISRRSLLYKLQEYGIS